MSQPATAIQDRILRIIVVAGSICVALGLLFYFGHKLLLRWQGPRLAKQAQLAVYQDRLKEASLLARRALQINPDDPDAARAAAEIAEKQGLPEAIEWRQRVLKALPNSASDRIALAWAALRFKNLELARTTLAALPEADRQSAAYHAAAAELAGALNQLEEADGHYAEALRLEPTNNQYRFSRAVLGLRLLDRRSAAEETLRGLAADPAFAPKARGALLADALSTFDWRKALPIAEEIAHLPEATFNDQIVYLDLLRRTGSELLGNYLQQLQEKAAATPEHLATLLLWMRDNGKAEAALAWSETLPAESKQGGNVQAAIALCNLTLQKWDALEAAVRAGHWEKWEYLRLALQARTLKERANRDLFEETWENAVSTATGQPNGIPQLLRLATEWGWTREQRTLYWALAENPATANTALLWLYQSYRDEKNTPGLQRVSAKLAQIHPEDDAAKNNLVMFALLLGRATDRDFETAHALFERHPGEATFVSTYAYSLLLQGKKQEARQVMEALRPDQLEEESTAAYYGLILAANGAGTAAQRYLALAKTGPLLPEEQKLIAEAEKKMRDSDSR